MSCSSAASGTNRSSDRQETSHIFGTEYSLPYSRQPAVLSQSSSFLIQHNIILPSTPKSPKWSLSLSCSHQNPAWTPIIHACYMPLLPNNIYLLTPLTFAAQYTHTCPQLYLQMNRVMWHTVTTIHHKAILKSRTVLLYYCCKVTKLSNKTGQKYKQFIS